MKTLGATWFAGIAALVGSAVACGSSADETLFQAERPAAGPGAGDESFGASSGAPAPAGREACATFVAEGQALPVHLVFMYDKSGSMRDLGKWTSCASAMNAFFAAPETKGMHASLAFFSYDDSCDVSLYATPKVAMRPLPDATSFSGEIAKWAASGKTPTLPAIKGAIQYAKQVEKSVAKVGGKVAIVLVTDGEPNGCGSTPDNAAAEANAVAAAIPTYVIGVGDALQNLDIIAKGGGTGKAIMVSTANPAQITSDLSKALGQIKLAIGCEYTVPSPPAGETLDYDAVNVVFTPKNAAPSTLAYSADCAAGTGWHYDDPAQPTRIVMCPQTCNAMLAGAADGKVEIELGCATKGGVPR